MGFAYQPRPQRQGQGQRSDGGGLQAYKEKWGDYRRPIDDGWYDSVMTKAVLVPSSKPNKHGEFEDQVQATFSVEGPREKTPEGKVLLTQKLYGYLGGQFVEAFLPDLAQAGTEITEDHVRLTNWCRCRIKVRNEAERPDDRGGMWPARVVVAEISPVLKDGKPDRVKDPPEKPHRPKDASSPASPASSATGPDDDWVPF